MNFARRLDAAVEVDRRDQRLVAVGDDRVLVAPAGLLLAAAEDQEVAEPEPLAEPRQRRRRDQRRLELRLLPFVVLRELAEEHVGDHEARAPSRRETPSTRCRRRRRWRPRARASGGSARARASRGRGTGSRCGAPAARAPSRTAPRAPPSTSSRWLSMIRSAASASSGLTATRRSQAWSFSASGNAVRELSLSTADVDPVRRRAGRGSTSASISDGVRKITDELAHTATRSAAIDRRLLDLDQDHRHVVVLIGAADERLDLAEDPLAQIGGLEMAVLARSDCRDARRRRGRCRRPSPR